MTSYGIDKSSSRFTKGLFIMSKQCLLYRLLELWLAHCSL